ncbi:MAG: FAD synthetase family protein [Mogibacterium sp.]|nr:FAD synthetase family protein [Mogibacterium sp.]
MIIYHDIDEAPRMGAPLAIALGTFDGIHMGHRVILEDAVSEARRRGIRSACYCFSNIPKAFIQSRSGKPHEKLIRLSSEKEKLDILREIGFDYVFSVPFDEKTMSMPAESFVRDTLIGKLNAKVICCGFNYTFGRKAEGNTTLLKEIASQYGVDVRVHDPVYYEGSLVSSTVIRALLKSGNEELAHKMLKR